MRKATLLSLMILMCMSISLLAAPYGKIAGRVTDAETGQPLPSVNVTIDQASSLLEALAGIRVIQAFGLEARQEERFVNNGRQLVHFGMKTVQARELVNPITEIIAMLGLGSLVVFIFWRGSAVPDMIGGSADLAPSTKTDIKNAASFEASNYGGANFHFGVREHGMAAAMNGMALHGGIIPYSGTFLVFSDFCRPSIRLSALMGLRVIYVLTHDSIGLGEDGPTHQPIEQLAGLRNWF